MSRVDLTGKRFHKLVALKPIYVDKLGNVVWLFQCDCGSVVERAGYRATTGHMKSCGCLSKKYGSANPAFTGYKEIQGTYFKNMRRNAKIRNLEYSVSKEYLWGLYLNQNKKCILTGRELVFGNAIKEQTASLDRIDSSKGYVEGNVQWVHKNVNYAKRSMSDTDFIKLCEEVVKKAKEKK